MTLSLLFLCILSSNLALLCNSHECLYDPARMTKANLVDVTAKNYVPVTDMSLWSSIYEDPPSYLRRSESDCKLRIRATAAGSLQLFAFVN